MPQMTSRRKPGVSFWATAVVVVVVVVYPLSYGPVCWLAFHGLLPEWSVGAFNVFYGPIVWLYFYGPTPIIEAIRWYTDIWRG